MKETDQHIALRRMLEQESKRLKPELYAMLTRPNPWIALLPTTPAPKRRWPRLALARRWHEFRRWLSNKIYSWDD